MQGLRTVLHDTCLEYAARPPGLYTLTAPTGSGKTLAMLAYSLKHAAQHQLRRVVMVIPYLTIIEQTASTYRRIFELRRSSEPVRVYSFEVDRADFRIRRRVTRREMRAGRSGRSRLDDGFDQPV